MVGVQLGGDADDETVRQISELAGSDVIFSDGRAQTEEINTTYLFIQVGVYGFLAIIGMVSLFYIISSISISVAARTKQYGVMRAVGMSVAQVTAMVAAEAITYASCGLVTGCAAGLYLHRLLTVKLILDHFGGVWKVPIKPLAAIVLLVILSCAAAVYIPAKRIREMSVTDTVN